MDDSQRAQKFVGYEKGGITTKGWPTVGPPLFSLLYKKYLIISFLLRRLSLVRAREE